MDVSQNPDLLKDKRGIIDGSDFFLKSPFRSKFFLTGTATIMICIIVELIIILHYSERISHALIQVFVSFLFIMLLTWFGALRHIHRMRALYKEGLINDVKVGSPMDIALGIAAGAIFDWLACISGAIFIALMYIWKGL
jgi:hypothetical protein